MTKLIVWVDFRYCTGNESELVLLQKQYFLIIKSIVMSTQALARRAERMPSFFDDFFNRPFSNFLDYGFPARPLNVPAVNITERKDDFLVSMAAPGLKKEDFKINLDGNVVTISSEKEEKKEESDDKITRREFSYSSFERSFSLPDDVNKEKIDARYIDGILELVLPKKEEAKKAALSKEIKVK
jgi:HSP20 family protein